MAHFTGTEVPYLVSSPFLLPWKMTEGDSEGSDLPEVTQS